MWSTARGQSANEKRVARVSGRIRATLSEEKTRFEGVDASGSAPIYFLWRKAGVATGAGGACKYPWRTLRHSLV
jgi:hypothetical protein